MKNILQERLSFADSLFLLSILGVITGLCAGIAMIAMHQLIDFFITLTSYQGTSPLHISIEYRRALQPLFASFLLIFLFISLPEKHQGVGVLYVMEKLHNQKGNLSTFNAFIQFIAAIIGLTGGLSIGKEGPAAHIGATFGSKIASIIKISQQNKEILIACGAAGAISAAFQTPLAGALFALEVILLGFQAATVLPVMLASFFAMIVSKEFIGPISLFHFDHNITLIFNLENFIALITLALGVSVLSSFFYHIQKTMWRFSSIHLIWRFLIVGVMTAICAIFIPEVLGVGYESLKSIITGQNLTNLIIVILLVKTFITALSISMGIPGGMIGPLFAIGGFAGAQVALWFFPAANIELITLFMLLGMAAMVSSSLQAPLAGLIGVIEMSNSSHNILPAMLVIAISCIFTRTILKQDSIFIERLKYQGKSFQPSVDRIFTQRSKAKKNQEYKSKR